MAHLRPAGGTSSLSSVTDNENAIRLLESLQNDFKCLSMETKKKYPQIKEVSTLVLHKPLCVPTLIEAVYLQWCNDIIVMMCSYRRPKRPLSSWETQRLLLPITYNNSNSHTITITRSIMSSIKYYILLCRGVRPKNQKSSRSVQ